MITQTIETNLAAIGEEISHELGIKMVKDYQTLHPNDFIGFQVGRNILENILSQPGCVGLRYYNAINELGQKTLVYAGINQNNEVISEFVSVNNAGELTKQKAIIADRLRPGPKPVDLDADIYTAWGLPE